MTAAKKEMEELKAEIDKLIEPLDRGMDLYFGGYKEEVEIEPFIQSQHRLIKYLRQIHESYSNNLAKALEENEKLQAVVLLASMENQPTSKNNIN